jgi:6-phosphogluconolactonase
MLRPSWFGST